MKVEIDSNFYELLFFGPQSEYEFAILNEIALAQDLEFECDTSIEPTKIIQVGNTKFYVETGDQLRVFEKNRGLVSISQEDVNFEGNDEQRMAQLLEVLGASQLIEEYGQINLFHFGMSKDSAKCNDCITNRWCKNDIKCGGTCFWTKGFKCVLN